MTPFPGYVCATGGTFHAELPLCYGTPAPYYWDLLSEEERAEREELTQICASLIRRISSCEVILKFQSRGARSALSM